ncbi:MAG: hypothetical protein PUP91_15495 [Rhizonema sp. PD37]|nr:hypothetical protein [Rhizonema sp. PD37]
MRSALAFPSEHSLIACFPRSRTSLTLTLVCPWEKTRDIANAIASNSSSYQTIVLER